MRPTATSNSTLPLRIAGFETVTEGLDYAARGETGSNFYSSRGVLEFALTYGEIRERSLAVAARLAGLGLERGSRVGVIAETTPDFLAVFYGAQYAGLIPVPLPMSNNLGGHEAYVARLGAMLQAAQASVAVASEDFAVMLREAAEVAGIAPAMTHAELLTLTPSKLPLRRLEKDEPCYVQYSSGSTSMPRGVTVMQRSIMSNVLAIGRDGLQLRQGDRGCSWLPLYHDMGLVGFCVMPAMAQMTIDYISTTSFARRPMVWLKLMSEMGSSVSFSPTFGYELCVRRSANGVNADFDLSRWRVAGIGSEMVRPDVLNRFAECFAPSGFRPEAFVPSYGLAESTLAVSFAPLDRGVKVDHVSRAAYEQKGLALPSEPKTNGSAHKTRGFVLCGPVLPGHAVEIRDEAGQALPERRIGRICIKGPSLMQGYFRNPLASAAVLKEDGWLDTGDMGYLLDCEIVVTGRSKDLIISNGRNIWPQDLEWAVESLPGLRPGCVAAFGIEDADNGERVVIVAECRLTDPQAKADLEREIVARIHRTAGVDCTVLLVPTRSLAFTSSGKLSRAGAKADYLAGRLMPELELVAGEGSALLGQLERRVAATSGS